MNEIYGCQINLDHVQDSSLELQHGIFKMEDRFRRSNILVERVAQETGDTLEDREKKLQDVLKYKLEIEDVTIERAHRMKPYQNNNNVKDMAAVRTIVHKLLIYKDKT